MYVLISSSSTPRYVSNRYVWVRSIKTPSRMFTERVSVLVPQLQTTWVPINSRTDELWSLKTREYYLILFVWSSKTTTGKRQVGGRRVVALLFGMKTDKGHEQTRWLWSYSLWPRLGHQHGSVCQAQHWPICVSLLLLDKWSGLLMPAALRPFRWLGGIRVMLYKWKSALTSVIWRLTPAVVAGKMGLVSLFHFPSEEADVGEGQGPWPRSDAQDWGVPVPRSIFWFLPLLAITQGYHFVKMKLMIHT